MGLCPTKVARRPEYLSCGKGTAEARCPHLYQTRLRAASLEVGHDEAFALHVPRRRRDFRPCDDRAGSSYAGRCSGRRQRQHRSPGDTDVVPAPRPGYLWSAGYWCGEGEHRTREHGNWADAALRSGTAGTSIAAPSVGLGHEHRCGGATGRPVSLRAPCSLGPSVTCADSGRREKSEQNQAYVGYNDRNWGFSRTRLESRA